MVVFSLQKEKETFPAEKPGSVPSGQSKSRAEQQPSEPDSKKVKKLEECKYCGLQFENRNDRNKHTRDCHSDEMPYECEVCLNRFAARDKLVDHSGVHIKPGRYLCIDCNTDDKNTGFFSHKSTLDKHLKQVHNISVPKNHKSSWRPLADNEFTKETRSEYLARKGDSQ